MTSVANMEESTVQPMESIQQPSQRGTETMQKLLGDI